MVEDQTTSQKAVHIILVDVFGVRHIASRFVPNEVKFIRKESKQVAEDTLE